ncbi:MAG: zinc-ribbon domain-containing protein [Deltaproteobacteria bacterium]|nr:zinc-ribbon domain-containing protein [Deltaproteobacteria bacterium]
MFCPECKTELPDDAKYCIRCGYDFTRIKTPPPEQKSSILERLRTSPGPDEPETPPDLGETMNKGELFARRYRILSEGKRGGMGVVYKCEDQKLNRTVALKIIHPRLISSDQAVKRFRQEVSISLELLHRNIVRVHNLDEYEGIEFFTMEWVEGKSLREILNERVKGKQPFNLEEAFAIISQLADALQYAHRHTIHRDIKPENVLTYKDEEGLCIKVTDFGIAKMLTPAQFTTASLQIGTPYYMAPEQKADAARVDKRADIYAMGVVLFELLTLENTVGLEMPSEINPDLPKEIDQIIKKAIATKPENRYGDVKELSDGLGNVVKGWRRRIEDERKKAADLNRKEEERLRREAEESERKKREEERKKKEEEKKRLEELKRKEEEEKRKEEQRRRNEEDRIRKEEDEEKRRLMEERKRAEESEKKRKEKEEGRRRVRQVIVGSIISVIITITLIIIYLNYHINKGMEQPQIPAKVSQSPPTTVKVPQPPPAPPAVPIAQSPSPMEVASKIQALKDMVKKDPQNLAAWVEMGNLYFDSNQPREAIEAYSQYLVYCLLNNWIYLGVCDNVFPCHDTPFQ